MGKKVLVVDDDRDFLKLMKVWLQSDGYEVVVAMDGVGSISTARKESPDVVVLDVGMPAGGGEIALRRLKDLLPLAGVPIVIVTGQDASDWREKLLAAGADGFVEKSFGRDAILTELRRHVAISA